LNLNKSRNLKIDASSRVPVSSDDDAYAWVDDPDTDEEWTSRYEEDMRQHEIIEENAH
jgi:hypothetical protein